MRDPGDECTCPNCEGELEPFIEALLRFMDAAVDNPAVEKSREEFVVHKPEHMSDAEWTAWVADMRRAAPDRADAGAAMISWIGM